MSGEANLTTLLRSMQPKLVDESYVFVSFSGSHYGEHLALAPKAMFLEDEGMTLVIPQAKADEHGLTYQSVFRCITLTVHSSLDAVGLTAAVSTELAKAGISANVIAAFYHDHIFVGQDDAEQAVNCLTALATAS